MPASTQHPGKTGGQHLHDEADIGSGERSPGQDETDELIRQVPPLAPSDTARQPPQPSTAPPPAPRP